MHRDTVSKEMTTFYDAIYDRVKTEMDPDKRQVAAGALKVVHETLNCCGKGLGTGLFDKITDAMGVTNTCPQSEFLNVNCHDRIQELFSSKIYLIGIAALVVAVIMIFEMIFSMVLCCGIRNSPVY